jgi:hypothetical protein
MKTVYRAPGDFIAADLQAGAWLALSGMLMVAVCAIAFRAGEPDG